MKKIIFAVGISVLLIALGTSLAVGISCGKDKPASEDGEELILNRTSLTLGVFESFVLEVGPKDKKDAVWSSSDPEVAEVAAGKVTGKHPGNAVITVRIGKASTECAVKIEAKSRLLVYGNFVGDKIELCVGREGITIVPEVLYGGRNIDGAKVKYTVSEPDIAEVTESGHITGLKKGNTAVILDADFYGIKGRCVLEVKVSDDFQIESDNEYSVYALDVKKDGTTPDSVVLTPEFTKNGEKVTDVTFKYTIPEDSANLVTVVGDGTVTGLSHGTANVIIEAEAGGETVTKTVKVNVLRATNLLEQHMNIEKYALYEAKITNMASADLSPFLEYFTAEDITEITEKSEGKEMPVKFTVNNGVLNIRNRPLGSYGFVFGTDRVTYGITCDYIAKDVVYVSPFAVINPHEEEKNGQNVLWKDTYSSYYDWDDRVITEKADFVNIENYNDKGQKVTTNLETGDISFCFNKEVTGIDVNPLDYDYIIFDLFNNDWKSESGRDFDIVFGVNGVVNEHFRLGDDLSEAEFGEYGKIACMLDDGGNRTVFKSYEWMTVVFDIRGVKELKEQKYGLGGQFIQASLNNAAYRSNLGITNIRLMTEEMYDMYHPAS